MPENHSMQKPPLVLGIALTVLSFLSACSGGSPANAPAPSPTKKWEVSLGQPAAAQRDGHYAEQVPAIGDDGTVYAGGDLGLHAIRPDGTEKWHFDSPGQVANVPVHYALIDDSGFIWFDFTRSDSGGVSRVGPDGKGGEAGSIAPVTQLGSAYDGTVYMATSASVLQLSIARDHPDVMWRGYATFMAFTADGVIFTRYPDILSFADKGHNVKWNHRIIDGGLGAPAIAADGTILLPRKGGLDAFDANAKRLWTFDLSDHAGSPAIGDDGTIYFGSDDKNLYALSSGGQLKWKFAAGGGVRSVPAVTSNGEIIFGSADHNLYALDSFGKLKWRFAAGGEVFSPNAAADGTIYFQSADGKLYAIQDLAPNGGLSGPWPRYGAGMRNTARAAH
jgi:outer membrane protein assembly factor BamB